MRSLDDADGLPEDGLSGADGPWPAIACGELRRPPPEHVLDHLVRHYVLDDDDAMGFAEAVHSAEPATVVVLYGDELPACDICERDSRGAVRARYDAPADRSGAWGYLCGDCFVMYSPGILGLGRGQYLMTSSEVSLGVRTAFGRARDYWRRRGIKVPSEMPFEDW